MRDEFFLAIRVAAFALSFEGLGLFGGERPRAAYAALAPCEPLMRLQRKVEGAARQAGIAVEGRRYLPHVTLGRFRPPGLEETMRLERAVASAMGFRTGPMQVAEFVLYESTLARGGSRYDVLARYPLGSADAREAEGSRGPLAGVMRSTCGRRRGADAPASRSPGDRPGRVAAPGGRCPSAEDLHAHRQACGPNPTGSESAGSPIRLAGTTTSIQR